MEMAKEGPKFKILMFPWLAHGHIFPFLELSKTLSARDFTIYLCSSAVNLDSIKSSIENELSLIKLVELQIPSSPQLPPNLHTTKNLPSDRIPILLQAFQESSSSFSDIMDSVKPDLLIYDLFQPWAPKMAQSRGVPCVYFGTSGATPFAYYHHLYTYGSGSTFPSKAFNLPDDEFMRILNRIAPNLKDTDDDFAFGNLSRSTDIVLIKSCRYVEEKYVGHLSFLCKKRIVCTGPLIAEGDHHNDDHESLEMIKWLDGKNQSSTIYISFGSEFFLSKDQIAEIAKGLQLCDVNFMWVIRIPIEEKTCSSVDREFPPGFMETVKERGLLVSRMAPQTKILGHPSIAGFVSHCGWSSITEAMYFGVPIIAMPMKSEQPINAKLAVEAGVGVEVEKDGNGVYVGDEVAKAINKVAVEETFYAGLRTRTRRLSETMRDKEEEEMNEAAELLVNICIKNKKCV